MTLRTRLTIAVAGLVAAAVAITGWLLVDSAEGELFGEVDAFLVERSERLSPFDIDGRGRGPAEDRRREFGRDRFSEDDAITQLILADGTVIGLSDTLIPVSDQDIEIATGTARSALRTVSVDGSEYRVITVRLPRNNGAVMVARDLDEVNSALAGIKRRAVALGVVGAGLAALVAWLLASRLSRPVNDLTQAAEHVAATQDLTASIEVEGTDELARLANSFNTMLEALATSRDQQQRLVMDASHELRTPLTSLRTNVDLLQRAHSLSVSERDEVLADVGRELDELSMLVVELVELSTSSRRPSEPLEDVRLAEVADAVATRIRRRFGRPVELSVTRDVSVWGYRSLLERALWNLADNAVKFSPENSVIDIAVDGTRLTVRDRGPGIDAVDRPHIFDRFYRSVATRSAPGSGLGLSIVADIVSAHDGILLVEEPESGPGVVVGFDVRGIIDP
jgi:two-component system sensor histidine kinase MprB